MLLLSQACFSQKKKLLSPYWDSNVLVAQCVESLTGNQRVMGIWVRFPFNSDSDVFFLRKTSL